MIRTGGDSALMGKVGAKVRPIYYFLNIVFHGLHFCVITFTLFGWVLKETRLANLILISLTLGSWYILGRWLGEGYCPVTDWHWKIRRRVGINQTPDSYVKLVLDKISRKDLDPHRVNFLTLVSILVSGMISLIMNILDWV